ncbi:hypothetical protein CYV19_02730 [Natronobacterium gregoryi SP2]|uniref:Uncharacterized protein n=1 Tax=Natronobacterium gregoryi (strain ATCC 43098 / DSM 3393 / CCM 3738 / CIP 104747 / IAM 13177 / JCM 8860 / NBRC 102187 / NCIMB 2189 / SP2) TaxID=797304 RepID=L9YED3_NATGS|nr:hypothetical protein C490_03813 [Natronobacterium gregoryi SP2]PLK21766.1 hypothetical protein CYV19_02730 [Natronobacterium gregoryi SP2]
MTNGPQQIDSAPDTAGRGQPTPDSSANESALDLADGMRILPTYRPRWPRNVSKTFRLLVGERTKNLRPDLVAERLKRVAGRLDRHSVRLVGQTERLSRDS